jgi:alkylation response protein AidB-like acyl-CoA dehydrogenase
VDFGLDETQQAVADLAATVLRGGADHDGARATHSLASGAGYDETLWKAMAQAGLLGLAVPTDLGGDGFGAIEIGCVLREVGQQILPVPALATLALGVLPIVALGTPDQQAVVTEVADGRVLTASLQPVAARREADDVVLDGVAVAVPYAAQAHLVLVPTEFGIALLDPSDAAVSLVRTASSTGAPEYTLRCAGARVSSAYLLAGEPRALQRFAIAGTAAVADGVIAAALELTAAHLKTRHQFGKPLAAFQAVAQQIADVYVVARTMNLAATAAAWRLGTGRDADDDLNVAAYWLAAELPKALQVCHHLHGGLGVDITYPLHRYYSQAKDLARFVGGASARLDLIGA